MDKDGNLQDLFSHQLVDFDSFPPSVLRTLENEYGDYDHNFNWNSKSNEFETPQEFAVWRQENQSKQFLKSLDKIIQQTTHDMILIKKREMAEKKLQAFEELIKETMSHEVLTTALTKYEEDVIMDPYASAESIEKGFREAKQTIDQDGNIDSDKLEKSTLFKGGDISHVNFNKFAEKNPEYQGAFKAWEKLFDEEMNLALAGLQAFRDSTSIERIRELRNFLINYKKTNKL